MLFLQPSMGYESRKKLQLHKNIFFTKSATASYLFFYMIVKKI